MVHHYPIIVFSKKIGQHFCPLYITPLFPSISDSNTLKHCRCGWITSRAGHS